MLKRAYLAAAIIVLNTVLFCCIVFAAGEWWARSVAPPKPETKFITVQNQHGAYHPWAGYRNTPGFGYVLGRWVPTVSSRSRAAARNSRNRPGRRSKPARTRSRSRRGRTHSRSHIRNRHRRNRVVQRRSDERTDEQAADCLAPPAPAGIRRGRRGHGRDRDRARRSESDQGFLMASPRLSQGSV